MIPIAWRSTLTKTATAASVNKRSHNAGVTLPELLVVVTLIAIIGTYAAPSLNSLEGLRLSTATSELTAALSYARDESIRTGVIHSILFDAGANRLDVLQLADFGVMPLDPPVVRHPISRQLYTLDFDDDPATGPTQIDTLTLNFDSVGQQSRIDFMPSGQPVWIDLFDQPYRLTNGSIVISAQAQTQTVSLDGYTGRVTSS